MERAGLALRVDCAPLPSRSMSTATCGRRSSSTCSRTRSSSRFTGGVPVTRGGLGGRARRPCSRCATPAPASPRRELPRLFERFHRVDGRAGRTFEGSGIGLALVQELVDLNGGTHQRRERGGPRHALHRRLPFGCATCRPTGSHAGARSAPRRRRARRPCRGGVALARRRARHADDRSRRRRRPSAGAPAPSARSGGSCSPTTMPTCATMCGACSAPRL